jgi:hypothetical protein
MKSGAAIAIALGAAFLPALLCGLPPQQPSRRVVHRQTEAAPVIFTAAPAYASLAALSGQERFPQGAQLMMRDGHCRRAGACVGRERRRERFVRCDDVLFSGKKRANDPWVIWEVSSGGGALRLCWLGRRI